MMAKYPHLPEERILAALGSQGKLFYWEHQGLTNDKTYIERQFKKNQLYYSVGIVPWENYIVTYDSTSGVDLRRVEFEIQNRLLG